MAVVVETMMSVLMQQTFYYTIRRVQIFLSLKTPKLKISPMIPLCAIFHMRFLLIINKFLFIGISLSEILFLQFSPILVPSWLHVSLTPSKDSSLNHTN